MLHKFPDSLLTELGNVAADVVGTVGATDATTQKVWDSYRAFRKTAIGWSKISLQGYMNARALPFEYG